MKKFWKWAVILMTATMATGLATSCEEKGNTEPEEEPEEEPVTIRKTWLAFDEESGEYVGYDLGSINGKYCEIQCLIPDEETADIFTEMNGIEVSVNDLVYVAPEDMGVDISMEITETDATSGTVRLTESRWLEYKNLTKDSVTIIGYDNDGTSEEIELRTPAGWGLTVNNYIDITSAAIQ